MATVFDLLIALGKKIDKAQLSAAEEALKSFLKETVGQGMSPYGEPWQWTKSGDAPPLAKAFQHIKFSKVGSSVRAEIGEPEVYHNYGAGGSTESASAKRDLAYRARKRKGEGGSTNRFHAPKRCILPDGRGMPAELAEKMQFLFDQKAKA